MTDEHFGYAASVPFRKTHPKLGPEHICFFHGFLKSEDNLRLFTRNTGGPGPRFTRNVFQIPDFFHAGQTLICTKNVSQIITDFADVKIVPAILERAYLYPFVPGDFSFEREIPGIYDDDLNCISEKTIQKYKCDIPDIEFFQIQPWVRSNIIKEFSDNIQTMQLPYDNATGLTAREFKYSPLAIEKYGFIIDMGYIMSENLFAKLDKYIETPYFWKSTFSL